VDRSFVPLVAERVDRALASVRERELVALDTDVHEPVLERGRRLSRGEHALEASR
jgi:hypothetical protein